MAKLLLVEDDNNLREIYEARLQAEGYEIITAKDGEEALAVAKGQKPDLIISDIMMPKVSGFEMLDILRNTEGLKDVKVIMLTALGQSDDQQRAGRLGSDRYLVKSQVTLEDIVKVAHELLDDQAAAPAAAATAAPDPASTPPATDAAAPVTKVVTPTVPTEPAASVPEPAAPATDNPAPADPPAGVSADSKASSGVSPATAVAKDGAQSTDQEEASVEAKIEDFVAGATTDASPPAEQASTVDEPSVQTAGPTAAEPPTQADTAVQSAAATTAASKGASDDKLMAQAVDSLVADTETKVGTAAAPAAADTPTMVTPTVKPEVTTQQNQAKDGNDAPVQVAHKKVITPIDSEPKADLDELLAVEAAKEAAAAPPAEPTPVISNSNDKGPEKPSSKPAVTGVEPSTVITPQIADEDAPSGAPAKPPSATADSAANEPNDPGSIAL